VVQQACPKCSRPLGPPLSSGRQVCGGCGWASQPKRSTPVQPPPSASANGWLAPSAYPNTPRNVLIYGAGMALALVGSLYLSEGTQLVCEQTIVSQQGECRVTEYNYLGRRRILQSFPTARVVEAQIREERRTETRRVRRRTRRVSYTLYHLVIRTTTGEITTPFNSRDRRKIDTKVQQVQRFKANSMQSLLNIHERGSPMTTAGILMGGAVFVTYQALARFNLTP